jgi:hypothetical protein
MAASVRGTGVALRLASDDEARAVAAARHGRQFELTPARSCVFGVPERPPADDDVLVVSQAFVERAGNDGDDRWVSFEHHGHVVPTGRDATLELLRIADDAVGDLVDILSDMRIAGLPVSRWELMSAPRRIELDPGLAARLAPLRRG